MESYPDAGSGLKKMFIAEVGSIVCLLLMIIPGMDGIASAGTFVFAILSIVGLYQAGKDLGGCRLAFILTIVKALIGGLSGVVLVATLNLWLALLFVLAGYVLQVVIVYVVCISVAEAAGRVGEQSVADNGQLVWKIFLGFYVAVVVLAILPAFPSMLGVASILNIVVKLLAFVAALLYTVFLYQGSNALQ